MGIPGPDPDVMSATTRNCPECDGRVRREETETVCSQCGLVVTTDRLDRGPDWRSFDDEDGDPKRTGAPLIPSIGYR